MVAYGIFIVLGMALVYLHWLIMRHTDIHEWHVIYRETRSRLYWAGLMLAQLIPVIGIVTVCACHAYFLVNNPDRELRVEELPRVIQWFLEEV